MNWWYNTPGRCSVCTSLLQLPCTRIVNCSTSNSTRCRYNWGTYILAWCTSPWLRLNSRTTRHLHPRNRRKNNNTNNYPHCRCFAHYPARQKKQAQKKSERTLHSRKYEDPPTVSFELLLVLLGWYIL